MAASAGARTLPTPYYAHLSSNDWEHVYEPSEDTFLMMDALEAEQETICSRRSKYFMQSVDMSCILKCYMRFICLCMVTSVHACIACPRPWEQAMLFHCLNRHRQTDTHTHTHACARARTRTLCVHWHVADSCRPLVCIEVGSGTGVLLAAVAKILGNSAFYL